MTRNEFLADLLLQYLEKKNAFETIESLVQDKFCSLKDRYYLIQNVSYYYLDHITCNSSLRSGWKRKMTTELNKLTVPLDKDVNICYPKSVLSVREYQERRIGEYGNEYWKYHLSNYTPPTKFFLHYSKQFYKALQAMPDPIKDIFYRSYKDIPLDYLNVLPNGKISYIPKNNLNRVSKGHYKSNFRVTSTFGKVIVKLVGPIYNGRVLEVLDYKWKAQTIGGIVEIWDSDRIAEAYLESNYASTNNTFNSSLWNSCMRHSRCSSYFDFYKRLGVKIAVELSPSGKIMSRALLWSIGKKNFLDRIYTIDNNTMLRFVKQVSKQVKLHYYKHHHSIFDSKGKPASPVFKIKCAQKQDELFPYCDTMAYYYPALGILTNKTIEYQLTSTTGGFN